MIIGAKSGSPSRDAVEARRMSAITEMLNVKVRPQCSTLGILEQGERSAVIYTSLGSCRRHGINPFDYLKDLFTRLPAAKITEIQQFTPRAWAGSKVKAELVAQAA